MKKNLFFLLASLIALIMVIVFPFFFNNGLGQEFLTTYLIAKIVFGLLFVLTVLYCFFKDTGNGITFSLFTLNAVCQFIPLVIRAIYKQVTYKTSLFAVLVLCLSMIIYIALTGLLISMNNKMVASEEKYKGHEIEVKEDK